MPKVSDEYVESRRRQILDAAAASFSERGPHGATIDNVSAAAGLSKGSVYGYFKSKEDIVSALKVESVQRDAAVVRSSMQQRDPGESFAAMLGGVLTSGPGVALDQRKRADVLVWAEVLLSQRLLDAQLLETQLWADALALLVQEAQTRGAIDPARSTGDVALMLECIVYGAVAMKSWDASFDPGRVAAVARALLNGELGAS